MSIDANSLKAIVKSTFQQKFPEAASFLVVEVFNDEVQPGLNVELSMGEAGPESINFPVQVLESEQSVKVSESFSDLLDMFKYIENAGFVYRYVIDLNERGEFRAHIEDPAGSDIYDINNDSLDEGDRGGLWLVEDGFIKSIDDISGLQRYLQDMSIIPRSASLEKGV